MGGICERLSQECVLLDIHADNKEQVIEHLVNAIAASHGLTAPDLLLSDVLAREALVSTCIGNSCFIPHAHSSAMASTVFAVARLNPACDMDTPDGKPVSLAFLMAGPHTQTGLHIKLLSRLVRLLHDDEFKRKLEEAADNKEFLRIICEKDD